MVLSDRWSLMADVSQDRFHCIRLGNISLTSKLLKLTHWKQLKQDLNRQESKEHQLCILNLCCNRDSKHGQTGTFNGHFNRLMLQPLSACALPSACELTLSCMYDMTSVY